MKHTSRPPLVLCISVTPAIQRTLEIETLLRTGVNRARRVTVTAAGKGVNVARTLKILGTPALLVGFSGDNGLEAMLDAEGLAYDHVRTAEPTRTCTTMVERNGSVTELVEEAKSPPASDWRALQRRIIRRLPRAAMVIAAGRLPPGAPVGFYAWLAREAARRRVPLLLDAPGEPMRRALRQPLLLAKMNDEEFAALGIASRDAVEMGAENFLITAGTGPVRLLKRGAQMEFPVARVKAVNTIGCGDATTAGIANALLGGLTAKVHTLQSVHPADIADAVRFGLACGSANALTLTPGELRLKDARKLLGRRA